MQTGRLVWVGWVVLMLMVVPCHNIISQEAGDAAKTDTTAATDPVIGLRGGMLLGTYPSGTFPNVSMVETGEQTGEIPSSHVDREGGRGYYVGIAAVIPFHPRFGLAADVGINSYSLKFRANTVDPSWPANSPNVAHPAVLYRVAMAELGMGVQWNVWLRTDPLVKSWIFAGYLKAGGIIGVSTISTNLIVTTTDSIGKETEHQGKFQSDVQLQTPFYLNLSGGVRTVVFAPWLELQAEVSARLAVNSVSDTTAPNDYSASQVIMQLGLGYRF
ncbi:MAG: hypothetical protein IT211_10950 [Armatimonadetes bacterium]|nr:hypothetical protein [Armatimonadota bacterium]